MPSQAAEIIPPDTDTQLSREEKRARQLSGLRPWKKGQSGNPLHSRGTAYNEAIALARQFSPEAMRQMIQMCVMVDDNGEVVPNVFTDQRVRAILLDKIFERAWGKPQDMKPEDIARIRPDLASLSAVELATLRMLMAKATVGALQPKGDQASESDTAEPSSTDSNAQVTEPDPTPPESSPNGVDTEHTP